MAQIQSQLKRRQLCGISMADTVGVRDTKDRRGGQLAVPTFAWSAFTAVVKTDRD